MLPQVLPNIPPVLGASIPPWVLRGGGFAANVDLNFAAGLYYGGSLTGLLSNTNATGGYATNLDGSLTLFAANTLRIGAGTGLLVEEARTNLALSSGNLADVAKWSPGGGTSGTTPPTMTANQATAPDGSLTAAKMQMQAVTSGTNGCIVNQPFTGTSAVYAVSVYLKGNVGGENLWLSVTPDGVTWQSAAVTLTTAWQRFSFAPTLTATSYFFSIGTDRRDASQTTSPAQTIFVWGAQAELGSFATSYIPTTTVAVARAADIVTGQGALVSAFGSPAKTFLMWLLLSNGQSTTARAFNWNSGAPNGIDVNGPQAGSSGAISVAAEVNNTNNVLAPPASFSVAGVQTKAVVAGDAVSASAAVTGGSVSALAAISAGATGVFVGNRSDGLRPYNGVIPRIAVWSQRVPDAALPSLVT